MTQAKEKISPLRQRMIEDMFIRHLAPGIRTAVGQHFYTVSTRKWVLILPFPVDLIICFLAFIEHYQRDNGFFSADYLYPKQASNGDQDPFIYST